MYISTWITWNNSVSAALWTRWTWYLGRSRHVLRHRAADQSSMLGRPQAPQESQEVDLVHWINSYSLWIWSELSFTKERKTLKDLYYIIFFVYILSLYRLRDIRASIVLCLQGAGSSAASATGGFFCSSSSATDCKVPPCFRLFVKALRRMSWLFTSRVK